METVAIRKCEAEDEKAVRELIGRVLNSEFPKEIQAFPLEDLNDINSHYQNLGEAFFVASANGKVIGTVGIKQEDERTAMLRRLFVDPTYRRKQVGTLLIDRAIQFCREVGYSEVMFKTTSTMQSAVQLCQKKGFVPRARLDLGPVQLLKFALFLKGEALHSQHLRS